MPAAGNLLLRLEQGLPIQVTLVASTEGNTMKSTILTIVATALCSSLVLAQPPGVTREMINTTLPEEGAPLAVPGQYEVMTEGTFGKPGLRLYRPADLSAFPVSDTLPVMVWGNGGCAIDNTNYAGFLSTIASHGFLVLNTAASDGGPQRATTEILLSAVDWAEAENTRSGSPLAGRIDTDHVAVMGTSCSGMLSIAAGTDPRVDTIGVFNAGTQPPADNAPAGATSTETLKQVHGPIMFINGSERDFMTPASHDNFERVDHVQAFYGARHGAGHMATMYHPGGGEFANVAWHWLRYQFKGDAEAGRWFTGDDCGLCVNPDWDADSSKM
jgi:hypothetical protein